MNGAIILNTSCKPVSGCQQASASRPPGFVTRASSLAIASWSGANITPQVRRHDVEARVVVRHRLGVSDLELDGDTLLRGSLTRCVDQDGRDVLADDVGAARSGEDRDRARAGGGVEHSLARLRVDSLDHEVVDVPDRVRDALVRAVAPHHAMPSLQLCECHVPSLVSTAPEIIGRRER